MERRKKKSNHGGLHGHYGNTSEYRHREFYHIESDELPDDDCRPFIKGDKKNGKKGRNRPR